MNEEKFNDVCSEIIEGILRGKIDRDNLESKKLEISGNYSLAKIPSNGEILERGDDEQYNDLREILMRKPMRTASGVSPIAIMTSPKMCPHGKCLYCPGGPASEFSSSQAYTGHEPAAARGKRSGYDPYAQVTRRLNQLQFIGHPVEKAELILMGGTMTSRSHDYQEWFVKRALKAMNDFDPFTPPETDKETYMEDREPTDFDYLEEVKATNETADVRCIGITFETKPDWCGKEQIDRMLNLGGTKVEIGVQTTYERINREMHRGHGVNASVTANKRLRDSGFKTGFHMMPGQPGMSKKMMKTDFKRLFEDQKWRPDYLKIYPTLIVEGTITYDMWQRDEFQPLTTEEAAEIIAEIKEEIPRYVRLQRVQRDIPADYIEAGVKKSNLRQIARKKLEENGETCDCIRCREIGHEEPEKQPELVRNVLEYKASDGQEFFISVDDKVNDLLVGFTRLRFPDNPYREELQDSAIIRELHVYGNQVGLGEQTEEWQHSGLGQELVQRAESIAADAGYNKITIISGIGVREYYKSKLGYTQDGPYVSKSI